jgi:hypothetical protein
MGLRATVVTKYEIQYGDTQGFNYGADELSTIIREFCDEFYDGDDGCGASSTDTIWEIDKQEFADMLEEIKGMSEEEFVERIRSHSVYDVNWNKEYIVDKFEGYLRETPENSNYVRLAWL